MSGDAPGRGWSRLLPQSFRGRIALAIVAALVVAVVGTQLLLALFVGTRVQREVEAQLQEQGALRRLHLAEVIDASGGGSKANMGAPRVAVPPKLARRGRRELGVHDRACGR